MTGEQVQKDVIESHVIVGLHCTERQRSNLHLTHLSLKRPNTLMRFINFRILNYKHGCCFDSIRAGKTSAKCFIAKCFHVI